MRVIFEPLEAEYQTIEIRTTELESFHSCAFKHKFAKQDFSNNDALLFGSLTHTVLQSYFFDVQRGMDTLDILCRSYDEWCKTIYDYIYLVESNQLIDNYRVICSEYKCVLEVEM